MRKFQNAWLQFCCFLTGYNYYILSNCSEISVRKVKKYTAALLIISIVWAFVGYCFCDRYIKLGNTGSIVGAIIAVLIVVQIERQILLAEKAGIGLKLTRIGLALLMAVLGSLIIDQIIFKDDIQKAKLDSNEIVVRGLMESRSAEIRKQISELNASISMKQLERKAMVDDISKNPTTSTVETTTGQAPETKTTRDSTNTVITQTTLKKTVVRNIRSIPNPNIAQLEPMDKLLYDLNTKKANKENSLLTLQDQLKKEVDANVGFIDELKIMVDILKGSVIAAIVYVIWLSFLLLLELLILIGKTYDSESDYDKTIQKQMSIHFRKIELL